MDEDLDIIYTAALARYVESPTKFSPSDRELAFSEEIPEGGIALKFRDEEWRISVFRWFGQTLRFRKIEPARTNPLAMSIVWHRHSVVHPSLEQQIREFLGSTAPVFLEDNIPPPSKFPDLRHAFARLSKGQKRPDPTGPAHFYRSKPAENIPGSLRISPLLPNRQRMSGNQNHSRAPPAG